MSDTAQPIPETEAKKSHGLGSYVVWAFVAGMEYVLSSGPVYRWCPALGGLYQPLWWIYYHTRSTPFHKPLGMYWHLWRPDMFSAQGRDMFPD